MSNNKISTRGKLSCTYTNILNHLKYLSKWFSLTYMHTSCNNALLKKPHWWLIDSKAQENRTFQEKVHFAQSILQTMKIFGSFPHYIRSEYRES